MGALILYQPLIQPNLMWTDIKTKMFQTKSFLSQVMSARDIRQMHAYLRNHVFRR